MTSAWLALPIAAAVLVAQGTQVAAASHSEDCCIDLEQRLAELEASVARKGNRALSLEVSGLVNQSVLYWDDGAESNAYIVTNENQPTRFRFIGSSKLDPVWEIGFRVELGIRVASSKRVNQLSPEGFDNGRYNGMVIRDSVWFVRNRDYGTIFVGTTFAATDRIAGQNLTQTNSFATYNAVEDTGLGMFLRSATNGKLSRSDLTWRRIIGAGGDQPGESERGFELVKYISPTWNGFTGVATWVADDFWETALRYRGQHAGFDIMAGLGYLQLVQGSRSRSVCAAALFDAEGDDTSCRLLSGSVSALHQATGLFLNIGASLTMDGLIDTTPRYLNSGVANDQVFVSGQAGIERRWSSLGKSTLYGEFYRYDGGASTARLVGPTDSLNPIGAGDWAVWHSNVNIWGAGLAQGIDSAAMTLYLSYRHVEGSLLLRELEGRSASGAIADAPIDDLDLVLTGAVISF